MNFLKLFFFEIYRRRQFVLISVSIAFIAWIVTIMFTDRYSILTIKNVKIETNLNNTQIEQLGLDVVKVSPAIVSVKIKGPRYKIGMLSKDDIIVSPISFRNIAADGDYQIELKAELKKPQHDISLELVSSNKSAIFSVDMLTTKCFNLTCNLLNISPQEGFVLDEPVCQPTTLCVSGPKKIVDCLGDVQLCVDTASKNLNSTKTFNADLKFISIEGKELDDSLFKYNELTKFSVTVPVYRSKLVPLTFMFKNAPNCLNLNLLQGIVNPNQINLGLSDEIASNVNELSMGYIDMRELDLNTDFDFKVVVPSGLKNLSQIDSAKVLFDNKDWVSKNFIVDDVHLINLNDDYEISVTSSVLEKVKIVAVNEMFLNNLSKNDITATVDLASINLKDGEQAVPVNIGILNKDGVWPVGFYKCNIYAKKIKKQALA